MFKFKLIFEDLTSKSATIKTNNWCVEAIHAVNAVLWQPGKQTQTDKPTNYL